MGPIKLDLEAVCLWPPPYCTFIVRYNKDSDKARLSVPGEHQSICGIWKSGDGDGDHTIGLSGWQGSSNREAKKKKK